ncbi:MAG: hypothetical protein NUW22_10160 [Acidobacteria bacterium]|nr:hypothetical protein [Acidobacteriota bacterium]
MSDVSQRRELAGITALSLAVTVALAAPVLFEPSTRVFGAEIVGRHHDPFSVMLRFAYPVTTGPYAQPVTDLVGALLARGVGPVAAYNGLVLLSFPLAAVAAFLLARHLRLAPVTSALAALAFAFSPFHLAQAAYHPHIAQVQWIPLYLLALWRSLDEASPVRLAWLALALVAVTGSNFYGGLIAAVLTPVAMAGYWWWLSRSGADAGRHLIRTGGTLAALVLGGMGYLWWTAPAVMTSPAAFAFPRADLFVYSAKWWSYAVPPVTNPWLGDFARRTWAAWDVHTGVLEQQVSVGLGVIALGLVAVAGWRHRPNPAIARRIVPMLVVMAGAALVCSLSPERTIDGVRFVRPSALLYEIVPMFRAYARFGVVVQLMAVLLAGAGLERLWRSGRVVARVAAIALVGVAAAEYTVLPASLWRDVLPTAAHRRLMEQGGSVLALDCSPLTVESASVEWLTEQRIRMASRDTDCLEPGLAGRLAADGFTHLLVRPGSLAGRLWSVRPRDEGLYMAADVDGTRVFEVTAPIPPVYTAAMEGFSDREATREWTWRWMGDTASWAIVNTGDAEVVAGLEVEVQAFGEPRQLQLTLDGRDIGVLTVGTARRFHTVPSFALPAGRHTFAFVPLEPPAEADALLHNDDRRRLSFAVGEWRWFPHKITPDGTD